MVSVLLIFVVITIFTLYYKYLNDKEEAEKLAKYFPTPRRTKILGVSIISKTWKFDPIGMVDRIKSRGL